MILLNRRIGHEIKSPGSRQTLCLTEGIVLCNRPIFIY